MIQDMRNEHAERYAMMTFRVLWIVFALAIIYFGSFLAWHLRGWNLVIAALAASFVAAFPAGLTAGTINYLARSDKG